MNSLRTLVFFLILGPALPAFAAGPPCNPCAGIKVADPQSAIEALGVGLKVEGEARLYVAWPANLEGQVDKEAFAKIRQVGGTPWALVTFRTPAPLLDHASRLDNELKALADLARDSGPRAHFQLGWSPESGGQNAKELGFLFKRAAVAISGAAPEARVLIGPLPADVDLLRAFYGEEVAAYVDGVALASASAPARDAAIAVLAELDPGKPVVVESLAWPDDATLTLALAAEQAAAGVAVTLFDFRSREAADLSPLKLLAREFQGDLSFDPISKPEGSARAWVFVRGSDLGLRVIAESDPEARQLPLFFADGQLRSPRVFSLADGSEAQPVGQRRSQGGLAVPIEEPQRVSLLKLERMSAAELEGVEEKVDVKSERQMPVEEILRLLQGFEDDQRRKLDHYEAKNRLNLRFRLGNGNANLDVAFEGPFFYQRDQGYDWVWQDLYVNGVAWRGKKLPEIPLIQPEKAAVLPLEINFNKDYSYRLRGTDTVEGRDCWVIDFEPVTVKPGSGLYQGTVWVDRTIYARVRTRALQVGLQGEVISSEETMIFQPVDVNGQPAEWSSASYFLPLRNTGQQIISLLNTSTQVERETQLTEVRINGSEFVAVRAAALASDATMVRDTDEGLRYLVKNEAGERVVKTEEDKKRLFALGGVFYDESLDFPLPLAGVNYLDYDFRGTGNQLNIFFAGALLTANFAEPRLFGSRWDAGVNVFGFFLPTSNELFRDSIEQPGEEIESSFASASFFLGHPLGQFGKLDFAYGAAFRKFKEADDTAPTFVLPEDTLTHSFTTELTYSRSGWRLNAAGSLNQRSKWSFWGLPGNVEFDQEQEDFVRWQASVAKTFWLKNFKQLGFELEYFGGKDLDRFSKYDFGTFADVSVAGYQGGLVLAEEVVAAHLSYGINIGKLFQVELDGDVAWATDELTGLDNELLAGIGLEGTVMGPWQTIVNFEVGAAVAGPGDGYSLRLVFLKLFG
jgi:hypothetical protein